MSFEPEGRYRSPIVGDLNLAPHQGADNGDAIDPGRQVAMVIELNVLFPGGLLAVRKAFYDLWAEYVHLAGGTWPADATSTSLVQPPVPDRLALLAPKLYQCVLSRADLREMVDQDRRLADHLGRSPIIFRVWPDYTLSPQIDRSAPTVKANAAWHSYGALGRGIVWAVIDSGIDACHPHFSQLELAAEGRG